MRLIIGLGNPGPGHAQDRHNAGFICLNRFARSYSLSFSRRRNHSQIAEGEVAGVPLVLAKPLTYMNQSGKAVASLRHWLRLKAEDLVVIHDDLDLPLGQLRLRPSGGSGGHRGLESIISALGTEDFARIRVGIGRPSEGDAISYVLRPFSAQEKAILEQVVQGVSQALLCLLTEGMAKAMSLYNRENWQSLGAML